MSRRSNLLVLYLRHYKTVVEEHLSSENVPTFCWSMIIMKQLCTINKQTTLNKEIKCSILWKKDQKKEKKIITLVKSSYWPMDCFVKRGFIIDSSILQEIFSCASKCLSCMRRKHIRAEMRCQVVSYVCLMIRLIQHQNE